MSALEFSPDGSATAAIETFDQQFRRVLTSRLAGGAWSAPALFLELDLGSANVVDLAVGADGTRVLAINERPPGASNLRIATAPPGGAFGVAALVGADVDGFFLPHVAVAGDGTVTATWRGLLDGETRVLASTRPPGGAFSSPDALSVFGEASFAHDLVMTSDAAAVAAWQVVNPLSSPETYTLRLLATEDGPSCGAGAEATTLKLRFATAQGCFTERRVAGTAHSKIWETTEDAYVGGFLLRPRAGAKLILRLDRTASTSGLLERSGAVDLVVGEEELPIDVGLIPVGFPQGEISLGGPGSQLGLFGGAVMQALGFKSFPVSGSTKLVWSGDGKSATLTAAVAIDDLMKALGDAVSAGPTFGGLSGSLLLKATNGKGIEVQTAEVKVSKVGVLVDPGDQFVGLDTFKLSYALRSGKPALRGEVKISIPRKRPGRSSVAGSLGLPEPKPLVLGGALTWADGGLVGAGVSVDGLDRPLGTSGVFLRGLAGELVVKPKVGFSLAGTADFLPTGRGSLVEGTVTLSGLGLATDCLARAWPVQLKTQITSSLLQSRGIGKLTGDLLMCQYAGSPVLELTESLDLRFDVAGQEGVIGARVGGKGWAWLGGMGMEGNAAIRLPILPTNAELAGTFVASTDGYAACASFGFFAGGFGATWLSSVQTFQGCDLSRYRSLPAPLPAASGRTGLRGGSGTGGARTVARGAELAAFRAVGTSGPPAAALVGPGGVRFVAPADGRLVRTRDVVIGTSAAERSVVFVVRRPAAGTWRIVATDAARPVARVEIADAAPDGDVAATVVRRGAGRAVRYRFAPAAGRTVQLALRVGRSTVPLGKPVRAARGVVRFAADPLVRRQAIVATVLERGVPGPSRVVARFQVAPVRRPGKVARLAVRRVRSTVVVRFGAAPRAASYVITATAGRRTLLRVVTTRTTATLRGAPKGRLTVAVTPATASTGPARPRGRCSRGRPRQSADA